MPQSPIERRFHRLPAAFRAVAIALIFVLAALVCTYPLRHVVAYPFIYLFFGATMFSAWFGGFSSGILAALLSSVCIDYFFLPPLFSLTIGRGFRGFETAFIVSAIAITAVSAARRRSEAAIRSANDQLERRVHERTTELQRSNQELKEREQHLRQLTEAIPQQIWRADPSRSIEYCNRNLLSYLGRSTDDLHGDGFYAIFHDDDAPLIRMAWDDASLSTDGFEAKARIAGRDGTHRWFIVRGMPQIGADGEVLRWYGVHIDVEKQEQAQHELLLAQERLTNLTRTISMGEMAASIAHQLKQPLTALTTDAHACRRWLQSNPPNLERATATAERIVQESILASDVVDRVRSLFSRTDYRREATDLNAMIRDLTRLLRDEAVRRNITIRLSLDEALPLPLADPVQIQQVLLNLVTNAMEATSEQQGEIEITTALFPPDEVGISVSDRGSGIPPEILRRIFEPFFTTRPQGTGMGLAICRSIVEEHDGKIWAESTGRQTVVHFTLKLV